MFKEFKEFAMRGNVMDMAIGVIIGGAFGKIVSSLVSDVVMPVLGLFTNNVDFNNLFIVLSDHKGSFNTLKSAQDAGAVTLNYGMFLGNIFNFLIIAFVIFLFVKSINRFKTQEEATTKECTYCAMTIPLAAIKCPNCTADLKS